MVCFVFCVVGQILCQDLRWQPAVKTEGDEKVYGSADLVNILARSLDSERNFNGSADPMITADRGFIQF